MNSGDGLNIEKKVKIILAIFIKILIKKNLKVIFFSILVLHYFLKASNKNNYFLILLFQFFTQCSLIILFNYQKYGLLTNTLD